MAEKRFRKRGQELSIGTLVLIVLGIIVLVLVILGLSIGWENLFSKIRIFQGSDLSSMIAACRVAVASNSVASYCEFKSVKLSDGKKQINCEYSEIEGNLDSKLDCPPSTTGEYSGNNEAESGWGEKKQS